MDVLLGNIVKKHSKLELEQDYDKSVFRNVQTVLQRIGAENEAIDVVKVKLQNTF